ncbi:MAG: oxygen-dependent coproporphyrinogen oxidase [Chitinophagaceae bacterium]
MTTKENFISFIHHFQEEICHLLEEKEEKEKFLEDRWERKEGGGGITKVITNGKILEKGGVNTSVVEGNLPEHIAKKFGVTESPFFACGISIVLHPYSPMIPTVHANFRYFELYNQAGNRQDCWFGGGTDLTPYYIFAEDGKYFHTTLKEPCDNFGAGVYAQFKKQCDDYFINTHRNNEARGIGGIFYDYLRPDNNHTEEDCLQFSKSCSQAFIKAYLPILEKRKSEPYTEKEKQWQEIRRGRYVEFNLLHDRGTLFGLKTNGRIESILMSLPPIAKWVYDYQPKPGSREAELVGYLKPRDWVNDSFT